MDFCLKCWTRLISWIKKDEWTQVRIVLAYVRSETNKLVILYGHKVSLLQYNFATAGNVEEVYDKACEEYFLRQRVQAMKTAVSCLERILQDWSIYSSSERSDDVNAELMTLKEVEAMVNVKELTDWLKRHKIDERKIESRSLKKLRKHELTEYLIELDRETEFAEQARNNLKRVDLIRF